MVLKITRFLTDAMNKQAKISHFGSSVKVGTPDSIKGKYKQAIVSQFGELFLNDANYVIITMVNADESGFDKLTKKFVELVSAVLDTEISKNEVKILNSSLASDKEKETDDEDQTDVDEQPESSGKVVLLIKVTTK